jgi:hypothetical protein
MIAGLPVCTLQFFVEIHCALGGGQAQGEVGVGVGLGVWCGSQPPTSLSPWISLSLSVRIYLPLPFARAHTYAEEDTSPFLSLACSAAFRGVTGSEFL